MPPFYQDVVFCGRKYTVWSSINKLPLFGSGNVLYVLLAEPGQAASAFPPWSMCGSNSAWVPAGFFVPLPGWKITNLEINVKVNQGKYFLTSPSSSLAMASRLLQSRQKATNLLLTWRNSRDFWRPFPHPSIQKCRNAWHFLLRMLDNFDFLKEQSQSATACLRLPPEAGRQASLREILVNNTG